MNKEPLTSPPVGMVKLAGPYKIDDPRDMEMLDSAIRDLGRIEHAIVRTWGTHYWLYRSYRGFREVAA